MILTVAAHYEPISRRPIANLFRSTASGTVALCVRLNIHPDWISYLSVITSAGAGVCFWESRRLPIVLLVAGPALCYFRLWLNMLDGMVALAAGKASPRGEILNDLPDRVSDVLVFVGLAHSGWCNPFLAYWAAIFALLTAYVGTLGQAVGGRREFSGMMSKPWRMVTLQMGALVLIGMILAGDSDARLFSLRVMDWTCAAVISGCAQTILVRLKRILSALKK